MMAAQVAGGPFRMIIVRPIRAFVPILAEHVALLDCGPIGRSR
jgi:hypothetical protein